jgi:hypothetical protein
MYNFPCITKRRTSVPDSGSIDLEAEAASHKKKMKTSLLYGWLAFLLRGARYRLIVRLSSSFSFADCNLPSAKKKKETLQTERTSSRFQRTMIDDSCVGRGGGGGGEQQKQRGVRQQIDA